ncbi:MAG: extracellular solute-binding protein [Actinomycetota bacterium]|nr:extracellular solute-binding protein [Actinomycetota bacterium]
MRATARLAAVGSTLALLVTACGGVGGGGDTGPDSSGDDGGGSRGGSGGSGAAPSGTIDTMGFSLQDVIASTRVDEVKKAYPAVRIRVAEGGFDEQQFLSAVASGEPPSLVYLSRSDLGTYAARGAILPLEDCIEKQSIDMGMYRDAAVDQVTYEGQVYGIPEFYDVRIVLADDDVLKRAGMTMEDIQTSDWQQLQRASEQLAQVQDRSVQRIGYDPKIPEFLPMWVAANGGQLVADDGTPRLNSPESVEALEYTVGLLETTAPWSQFKAFRDTWDFFGGDNQFVKDQLGAFPVEQWYLDVLAEVSPDVSVTAQPFLGRDGQPVTYATGQAWAIPKGSEDTADAACAFMKVMTAPDTWVAAAQASKQDREKTGGVYTGTYTANEEADERIFSEVYEETGQQSLDQATQVVLEVQDAAVIDPPSPAAAEVKKAWEDAVLRALEGEQTPQEALEEAQKEAEEAVAGATS